MQNIIDKIQSGELSQKQLINELVQYNDKNIAEYDDACDVVENNQSRITELESQAKKRENNIVTIQENALKAVDYARTIESDNIRLKSDNKDIKQLRNENKALKKLKANHLKSSQGQAKQIDQLTKDCREYRKKISVNQSDIARLRLTGMKTIDNYSFTIFPSKTEIVKDGATEKQVNLVIMDKNGNLKIVGIDGDGNVSQPRSHNFKLSDKQELFVKDFDRIAKEDGYQFTDRVLSLVN